MAKTDVRTVMTYCISWVSRCGNASPWGKF